MAKKKKQAKKTKKQKEPLWWVDATASVKLSKTVIAAVEEFGIENHKDLQQARAILLSVWRHLDDIVT